MCSSDLRERFGIHRMQADAEQLGRADGNEQRVSYGEHEHERRLPHEAAQRARSLQDERKRQLPGKRERKVNRLHDGHAENERHPAIRKRNRGVEQVEYGLAAGHRNGQAYMLMVGFFSVE